MTSVQPISSTNISGYDGNQSERMTGVACSADGTIIYISLNNITNIGVIKSTDSGATWNVVYTVQRGYTSIACSYDGTIVYLVNLGDGLYKSINSGNTWNKITYSPNTLPGGLANPENSAPFAGYRLSNIFQIACDSTGTKLIMTTNAAASIYQSINGGSSWSLSYVTPGYSSTPNSYMNVTSSADGSILYAALNSNTTKNIIVSKDSGLTWNSIDMLGVTGPFNSLSTNSYGDFVYAIGPNSSINTFYPTHVDKGLIPPPSGITYRVLAVYNNGNNIIICNDVSSGTVSLYTVTNKYSPGQRSVPCFKDDTKILCFKENREVYVKVQDIRKSDLIKTLKHGYIPVNMIGTSKLYNSGDTIRGKNKLYVCTSNKYPDLIEDLVITGCHSILEDNVTEKQINKTIELVGLMRMTDDKYRLMACLDERTALYMEEGVFNIWHIALDNSDYFMNYGIYANGLLVETCSKRYLKEISGMTLIE